MSGTNPNFEELAAKSEQLAAAKGRRLSQASKPFVNQIPIPSVPVVGPPAEGSYYWIPLPTVLHQGIHPQLHYSNRNVAPYNLGRIREHGPHAQRPDLPPPAVLARRLSAPGRLAALADPRPSHDNRPGAVEPTSMGQSAYIPGQRRFSLAAPMMTGNPYFLAYSPAAENPYAPTYRRYSNAGPALLLPYEPTRTLTAPAAVNSKRRTSIRQSHPTSTPNGEDTIQQPTEKKSAILFTEKQAVEEVKLIETAKGWKLQAKLPGFTKHDLCVLLIHDPQVARPNGDPNDPLILPVAAARGDGVRNCAIYLEAMRITTWTDKKGQPHKQVTSAQKIVPLGSNPALIGSLWVGDMVQDVVHIGLDKA